VRIISTRPLSDGSFEPEIQSAPQAAPRAAAGPQNDLMPVTVGVAALTLLLVVTAIGARRSHREAIS
jgi:hypothetical protein